MRAGSAPARVAVGSRATESVPGSGRLARWWRLARCLPGARYRLSGAATAALSATIHTSKLGLDASAHRLTVRRALLQFAVGSLLATAVSDARGQVTPGFLRLAAVLRRLAGLALAWPLLGSRWAPVERTTVLALLVVTLAYTGGPVHEPTRAPARPWLAQPGAGRPRDRAGGRRTAESLARAGLDGGGIGSVGGGARDVGDGDGARPLVSDDAAPVSPAVAPPLRSGDRLRWWR